MVVPVQIQNTEINTPKVPEGGNYIPEIAKSESSPITPEEMASPDSSNKPNAEGGSSQPLTEKNTEDNPQPGKIVDKATKHKEKISTLVTPDETTEKADKEENEFIPLVEEVHNAAHEQHT